MPKRWTWRAASYALADRGRRLGGIGGRDFVGRQGGYFGLEAIVSSNGPCPDAAISARRTATWLRQHLRPPL